MLVPRVVDGVGEIQMEMRHQILEGMEAEQKMQPHQKQREERQILAMLSVHAPSCQDPPVALAPQLPVLAHWRQIQESLSLVPLPAHLLQIPESLSLVLLLAHLMANLLLQGGSVLMAKTDWPACP